MSDDGIYGLTMRYFVLKPRGDDEYAHASRSAMLAYARAIESNNALLAQELREWVLAACPDTVLPDA